MRQSVKSVPSLASRSGNSSSPNMANVSEPGPGDLGASSGLEPPTITAPLDGSTVPTGYLTVAGTGPPDHAVELFDWLAPAGKATVDVEGLWRITLPLNEYGTHIITAKTVDERGHRSAGCATRTITFTPEVILGKTTPQRHRWRLLSLVAVGILVAVALVIAAAAFRSEIASQRQIRPQHPDERPVALKVLRATGMQVTLSWRPVPRASSYLVHIGNGRYLSKGTRFTLVNNLEPNERYFWTVQAGFSNRFGAKSRVGTLAVPPLPLFPALTVESPGHRYEVRQGKAVPFCWLSQIPADHVEFLLNGNGLHLRRTLTRSQLRRTGAAACLTQELQAKRSYAWQVSALATGYAKRWTPWFRVWITRRPSHRRRYGAVQRAPQPVQPQPVQRAPQPVQPQPVATVPAVLSCPNPPTCQ
jgi:hypothetical protein